MKKVISFLMSVVMLLSIIYIPGMSAFAIDNRVEKAVQIAIGIANDNSHGYSQSRREGPDYDCASLVYYSFTQAGFTFDKRWFATPDMGASLEHAGFKKITGINFSNSNSLQRGDILWKSGHTEIYIGSNNRVGAHSDRGYPQTGDQTGTEISVSPYWGKQGWTAVYRYGGSGGGTVAPQPAASSLTLSTSIVNLNIDSSPTATVSMTAGGTLPSKIATTYKTSNGNVQCSWNKWSGNTCSLNITAKNIGASKITVNLINNSTNAVLDTKTISVNVTSNKYTVTFNANGGYGAPSNMTVSSRDVATIPDTKPYTNISNNVTFNANGGTLTNGSKTEYKKVFKYWYDNDGNQYYAGSTYVFKKNTTLYAKYAYETLDAKTPTKSNCYFDGWYDSKATDNNGMAMGNKYTRNSEITKDITLYAMWTQSATRLFGDINNNGKIDQADSIIAARIAGKVTIPKSSTFFFADVNCDGIVNTIEKNGETVLSKTGSPNVYDADRNLIMSVAMLNYAIETNNTMVDRTKYLKYEELPVLKYFTGLTVKSMSKTTYNYGEEFDYDGIVLQSNYSNSNVHHEIKDDYVVTGYDPYKIGKQTITIRFYQYSTTATVTVKAPNYEVKLNTVGGVADKTAADVTLGSPMTSLPVPEKEGYTFVGWFDAEEGGNQITSSTVFNSLSSNEIYAHWEKNKYSVTFNSNGGNNSPQNLSNVLYDTSITIESTIPQKSGLVFKGWSLINEDTGEYLYPGQKLNIEKDTTLYAIYGEQSIISQSSYVEGYVANPNMPATFKFVAPKTENYHFDIFGQENLSATIKYGNVALSTTNNTNYENGFAFDVKLFENQEYILTISSNENDEHFLAYVESLDNIEHSHDYVETERVEATTSSEGYIKYTCSFCGDTKVTTIPKLQPAPTQPSTPATQPTQAPTQQPAPAPTQAPTTVAPAPAEPTTVPTTVAPTTATQVEQTTTPQQTAEPTTQTTTKPFAKPKSAKLKKATGSKKAITLTWAKVKGVKGYQIQVATDKKFKKNKKTVTIKKQKTTKTTVKKLKAKKKYFVRIRTYKTVNGKKVYSSWSKAKTVKTK